MSRHAYAYVQMHIYLHHHIPWIIQNNCFSIPITSQFNLTVHFHTVRYKTLILYKRYKTGIKLLKRGLYRLMKSSMSSA